MRIRDCVLLSVLGLAPLLIGLLALGNLINTALEGLTRCTVPECDDTVSQHTWKEQIWNRYYTAAPERQRQFVAQYNAVKRA